MSGTFRPVELPDLGATLARMAQVDATRQQVQVARQQADQERAFNTGLAALAPRLASGQGDDYLGALGQLAGLGARGAQMALPMLQQERQRQEAANFWQQPPGGAPPAAASGAAGGVRTGAAIPIPANLDDADILARTLIGEAANQGEEGQRAVAHVIRNRMNQTGAGVRDVVLAPNQFEPWGTRREELLRISPTDPRYIVARNIAESALAGHSQDPTRGATHFLNPDLQRQLGRRQPAWAPEGQGQRIGAHVFYTPGGGVRVGGGATIPASAGATPVAAPAGVSAGEMALIERALQHPNPEVRRQGEARLRMLQLRQQNNPETYREETREIGGRQVRGQINSRTGQFTPYPGQSGAEQTGPFGGTGMEAQANNIVLRLAEKIRGGTASPEEQALYQRAYTHLAEGTVQFVADPSDPTGQRQVAVRVPRNMGDLPQPVVGGGAPTTVPTQAGGAAPGDLLAPAAPVAPADAAPMPGAPGAIPGMERMAPPPANYQRRPDGSVEPIPGGPADPARQPLSEAQGRSNFFGNAMRQADDILGRLQVPAGAVIAAWRNAPEIAVNPILSANDQQYFNAVRLFAAGVLRKETGAAFTANELLDVQSRFFPMPGDSREVLEQKAAARRQAIAGIQAELPGGRFRGAIETPGPGGVGTAEPPPPPPPGFRIVR